MAEPSLLSDKLHRFGVLGACVIPDSLSTLKHAQAQELQAQAEEAKAEGPSADAAEVSNGRQGEGGGAVQVARESALRGKGSSLTREQILEIIRETVRVQGIVQQEVSTLARKLAKADKKKKKSISFMDGHSKILELGLPREPLDEQGLTESDFQQLLAQYEEDEEVMLCAQQLLHPVGKGDPERAKGITVSRIVEIHQFMVTEMDRVLQEFLQLPQETRRTVTGKGCETTAELLVSIAVEQQMAVRCEDVEQAVIRHEEALQQHPEFTQCTERLANMMQHLIGAAQPRAQKSEFVELLHHMGEANSKAKAFAKKVYEDYRAKTCNIVEAYRRFDAFSEETARQIGQQEDLPDLSSIEMQLCYNEYKEDAQVRSAWEKAGVESNMLLQAVLGGGRASSSPSEPERKKKVKASEIVEMQELMVDEMKRATEAAALALGGEQGSGAGPWKPEIAMQMVHSLASAAVERRYGTSAEEMTAAGFMHAAALQRNERFMHATEKQQEILRRVTTLCGEQE